MSYRANRKVTPKVTNGQVQKKHRHAPSPNVRTSEAFVFEKDRPGKGYFHVVSLADILAFIEIIPNWPDLSEGLRGVRLTAHDYNADGMYDHEGIICLAAWERTLWREVRESFFLEHRKLFDRIGLQYEKPDDAYRLLKHTHETAKAYQLLHVFLHELGHHCDRMTTRSQTGCPRGEPYAEAWAFEFESKIVSDYEVLFGQLR